VVRETLVGVGGGYPCHRRTPENMTILVQISRVDFRTPQKISSLEHEKVRALIKVSGCVAIWWHRLLLLKLCAISVILLMLLRDGKMRETWEQGVYGFQQYLAWRGPRATKVIMHTI